MKTNSMKTFVFAALCVAGSGTIGLSATYTWNGGGGNAGWKTDANWVGGVAPGATGQMLVFTGTNRLLTSNDGITSVPAILFDENAGAFTLSGNTLTLSGTGVLPTQSVTNLGTKKQTIALDLILGTERSFITKGDILISGNISSTSSTRGVVKYGSGTLELSGNNSYLGSTTVIEGTLLVNAATGNINSTANIRLGDPTGYSAANNPNFVVKGGDLTISGGMGIYNYGENLIKADGGAVTAGSYSSAVQATTHFDVSKAGSSIAFTTAPSTSGAGRIYQALVTDESGITSFATVGTGNKVVALTGLVGITSNPSTTINSNAVLAGSFNNTTNNRNLSSLTLKGAGTATGSNINLREILMQEGTGNYTFNQNVGVTSANHFYVHQYSTSGTLTFNGSVVGGDDKVAFFVKSGPGTVRIATSSTSAFTGPTRIQSGELILDGAFTNTSAVHIYRGATLSGAGSIGATTTSSITIREGGKVSGSTAAALDIGGRMTFESGSAFAMTLTYDGVDFVNATGVITLNSEVDLQLVLAGAPVLNQTVTLLNGGTFIGTFATINGSAFGADGTFSLNFNSLTYNFQILYQSNGAQITALSVVPEPSALLLGGFSASALLLLNRRCRRA